jgi:hypothetical protein
MTDTPKPTPPAPEFTYDEERWGPKAGWNITDEVELDGFRLGERVRAVEDNEDEGYFSGDEGQVIGVSRTAPGTFNPAGKVELIVAFERMDPLGIPTTDLEHE